MYDYLEDAVIKRFERENGFYSLRENETHIQFFNLSGSDKAEEGLYTTSYNFSYYYTFKFEEDFEPRDSIMMMRKNVGYSNFVIAAYLLAIFGVQHLMRNRPRYELRFPLFCWSFCLGIFSIWGALRSVPEMIYLIRHYGLNFTVCFSGKPFLDNRVGGFWNWMFTLSKVPELGDTIFIVLRKQPLIFLHWYHHVTVLLYSWYSYSDYIATARWFICMNYLVHSTMYTYYAMKALKIRVPRFVSMIITTAQLLQMIMGTAVNIWAYQVKQAGNECHVSYENINLSLLMYTSYFVLFARFFRRAYMAPKRQTASPPTKKKIMYTNGDAIHSNGDAIHTNGDATRIKAD